MSNWSDDREMRDRLGQLEALLGELEAMVDEAAQAKMRQVVQTLLDYEKAHQNRADVVTMFERRIAKLEQGG